MAVLQNMWLRGAKKKLGGTVLYTQGGRTLQRELAPEVKNPKTPAQMGQRVKWSNLVAFYRANAGWMPKAFENKKPTQSDYNKFMSLNAANSRIYLTKEQARQGACVVDSYRVSDGTLQPVDIFPSEQNWVTNLYLGDLADLDAETSVALLSKNLLQSNAGLRSGDQLSFIRVTQLFNNTTNIPYVQVRAYELVINEQGTGLVGDYWPIELLGISEEQGESALLVKNNNKQGGFAMIVSRTQGGRVLVSPSQITQVNMGAIINQYSSDGALSNAILSYGQGDEVFLDSKGASAIGQQPTTLSMTSISSKNGAQTIVPGADIDLTSKDWDDGIVVNFNNNISGDVSEVKVNLGSKSLYKGAASSVQGASVTVNGKISTTETIVEGTSLVVEVIVSGISYNAAFNALPSSLT